MAEPKNEKEWAIYNEMMAEAEKDPVFGDMSKQTIENFKNDQEPDVGVQLKHKKLKGVDTEEKNGRTKE